MFIIQTFILQYSLSHDNDWVIKTILVQETAENGKARENDHENPFDNLTNVVRRENGCPGTKKKRLLKSRLKWKSYETNINFDNLKFFPKKESKLWNKQIDEKINHLQIQNQILGF